MEDWKGKKEEAFSFGGQLDIVAQKDQTICKLISAAPILEISQAGPIPSLFIEQLEILLAELRARYVKSAEYETQLCQVDPCQFYLGCLDTLVKKIDRLQHKDENHQRLMYYLHSQKHRLHKAGLVDESVLSLEEIFVPGS